MKPKVFIGSSGEAHEYASAIQAQLDTVAECTPWTAGAFELSESNLQNLIANVRDSDFGVFVFAPDDTTIKRDSLLHSPRDNVIFEAGLFAGYLGPERCFIAIPQQAKIHLASDLLGISFGHYEDDRSDDDERSAVNSFCREIRKRIEDRGLFRGSPPETLRGLATKFDCCKWISDKDDRVKRREEISYEIEVFCRNTRFNKHRLLAENSPGYAIALFAAIKTKPKANDWKLIRQMKGEAIPSGFVHYKLLDTVEALKANSKITAQQLLDLQEWLKSLPDQDDGIKHRVNLLAP